MNMNFNSNNDIQKAFNDLFKSRDEKEDIDFQAHMIMFRFLSEIEILTEERKMTRKELAQRIGTSASYITQLYRGNKLLNLETIAKLQKVFDITFDIKANANAESAFAPKRKYIHPSVGINHLKTEKVKQRQNQIAQEPSGRYSKKKKTKKT